MSNNVDLIIIKSGKVWSLSGSIDIFFLGTTYVALKPKDILFPLRDRWR